MTTDTELVLAPALVVAPESNAALIEALTQACLSARDFVRREYGWPYPAHLWADATLKMLDAVIQRAEAQS